MLLILLVAIYHSMRLIVNLPFNLSKYTLNYLVAGFTISFSSPMLCRKQYNFGGNQCKGIFNLCPMLAHNVNSLALMTIEDKIIYTALCDESGGVDP